MSAILFRRRIKEKKKGKKKCEKEGTDGWVAKVKKKGRCAVSRRL